MMTTCRHGHPRTAENTYRSPKGKMACRVCLRTKQREAYETTYRSLRVSPLVREPKRPEDDHA